MILIDFILYLVVNYYITYIDLDLHHILINCNDFSNFLLYGMHTLLLLRRARHSSLCRCDRDGPKSKVSSLTVGLELFFIMVANACT